MRSAAIIDIVNSLPRCFFFFFYKIARIREERKSLSRVRYMHARNANILTFRNALLYLIPFLFFLFFKSISTIAIFRFFPFAHIYIYTTYTLPSVEEKITPGLREARMGETVIRVLLENFISAFSLGARRGRENPRARESLYRDLQCGRASRSWRVLSARQHALSTRFGGGHLSGTRVT